MNQHHRVSIRHREVPSSSRSCEEDVEDSSIMGQARSSIMGQAMSDWDSNAGGADSTMGGGLVTPRTRRLMEGDECENIETATVESGDEVGAAKSGGGRSVLRIFRWWSEVVSRVSRSASSLLSQQTPNLNDILDGTGDNPLQQPPRRGVQRSEQSIPEDSCGPKSINDTDSDQEELFALRGEVALLKKKIQDLEAGKCKKISPEINQGQTAGIGDIPPISPAQTLRPDQISRYSRQLLLNDGFGVAGQRQLLSTSLLVVGAGGIGSAVLLYLAAAGVGHITIVDYDCLEMSNLHRQVIHNDADASKSYEQTGMNKAISAKQSMLKLNPTLSCTALPVMISGDNALELVSRHDVVVDACDNPRTRYLLNDACIFAGKPLVSGSAMGTEGQLTVYNYQPSSESGQPKKRTACYRCLYPNPVPTEGGKSCNDNGVLGMVPGAIGVLQAVEAMKVVTGIGHVMHDRLLMYDSLQCSFLNVKKPPARSKCAVCSLESTIKTMKDSEQSLENVRGPSVCGITAPGSLPAEKNVSCSTYNNEVRKRGRPHILLDVRVPRQYEMCSLDGSKNMPLEQLKANLETIGELSKGELPIYCICRRGIASVEATRIIQKSVEDGNTYGIHSVYNISGGLNAWVKAVDSDFPQY